MKKYFSIALFIVVALIFLGCNQSNDNNDINQSTCEVVESKVYLAKESNQVLAFQSYNYWHTETLFPRTLTIQLSNNGTNDFKIHILTPENFSLYHSFQPYTGYTININSQEKINKTIDLDFGRYYIIIDNEYKFIASYPSGSNPEVEYEITMYYEK